MNNPDVRRKKILGYLKMDPFLTQMEICQKLNEENIEASIRTIKYDYKALGLQGCKIKKRRQGAINEYEYVDHNNENSIKNSILGVLLLYGLTTYNPNISKVCSDFLNGIVSRTKVFKTVKPYLEKSGLLKKEEGKWLPTTIFMSSLPDDYSELFNFAAHCLASRNPEVKNIYKQAINYLYEKNMIVSNKLDVSFGKIPFYIQKLKKAGADKNPISFYYKSKEIPFFYLGFWAYSIDKDTVYLIGKSKPTKWEYRILKANDIVWDSMKSTENQQFSEQIRNDEGRNKLTCFFKRIKAEMFDISEESLKTVKVRIKYSLEAGYEMRELYQSRLQEWGIFDSEVLNLDIDVKVKMHSVPKLKYYDSEGKERLNDTIYHDVAYIEYSDNIRGLSNFANFLRRFGDDVTVLENDKLKKIMKNGAERALLHYI